MTWTGLLDILRDWLRARELFEQQMRWVVGVSGGPDSTLLLRALHGLNECDNLGWKLHVGHLHHGLRPADADEDAEFVEQLCNELHIPFHHERVDIRKAVDEHNGSTEEIARKHRYDFLERVALKSGAEQVAVAHHADDNAETVLHRICRGTGLRGLAGMSEIRAIQPNSRVRLVRPLLGLRRRDIERICADEQIASRLDATNLGTEHTRARIRNAVLPMLEEQVHPKVNEALLRLAEQARWVGTYLEENAARAVDSVILKQEPRFVALSIAGLLKKKRIMQGEIVRMALAMVTTGAQDLGFTHIEGVLRLASESASGKEIHLPGATVVRKVYDRLEFGPRDRTEQDSAEIAPVFLDCPGSTTLAAWNAQLHAELCEINASKIDEIRQGATPNEEWLDFENIQLPLLVRGRRDGDRFWPLGAPGSKTVGDFLSAEKVDPNERDRTGVLCDQAGPVWVIGLRIDERVKLRPGTRQALHLKLESLTAS